MSDKKDNNLLSFTELVEVTQRCISIPSLSGREEDAHTVNESISLSELETAYRGFRGICRSLLRT